MDNFINHLGQLPRRMDAGLPIHSILLDAHKTTHVRQTFASFNFSFILSGGGSFTFRGQTWPGNVRELENTIERAVLLATADVLSPADLWPREALASALAASPAESGPPSLEELPLGPLRQVLGVAERWMIQRALAAHAGNRQETARVLGVNRTTLFNKMRKYNLLSSGAVRDGQEGGRHGEVGAA